MESSNRYVDGFVLPIPRVHLDEYRKVAEVVATIWKEYGALEYVECVGDDMSMEGIRSFPECIGANEDEVVIFGWTIFESREARDRANEQVPQDPRMEDLIAPLTDPSKMIFNAGRMVYGGFKSLV